MDARNYNVKIINDLKRALRILVLFQPGMPASIEADCLPSNGMLGDHLVVGKYTLLPVLILN